MFKCIIIISQGVMAESKEQNQPKNQQEPPIMKSCEKCMKFFFNEAAYESHIQIKHQDNYEKDPSEEEDEDASLEEQEQQKSINKNNSKKSGKNAVPIRSRMLQIQRNELQDNTYTFLGELGEKNIEPVSTRAEIINFTNDHKLTGHTHYSVNKVIRTPYEEPIKCSDQIVNALLQKSKNVDFLYKLKKELIILQQKIEQQRQMWQLRDPMAPEEEVMDEFSLMDIKKLIQNYPKRRLSLQYPHLSIFLLWIGRICKSPAFQEFFLILGQYIAEYYSLEQNQSKNQSPYDNWKNYHKNYQAKKVAPELLEQLKIFDEKNCKKFVQYFVQWSELFKALSI